MEVIMKATVGDPELPSQRSIDETPMATASTGEKYQLKARTQAEEDAYDLTQHLPPERHTGNVGAVAHLVKGALGAGLLGGHEAYEKGGLVPSCILQAFIGVYMTYCIYILVRSTHIIYRRLQTYNMSYADVGEAALEMCPSKRLAKFSKVYRYMIDVVICIDLFGSCACYQLIIAKTIKQLVENDWNSNFEGIPGYPNVRVYLAIIIIPCIIICLITNLKYLAPFSVIANSFIVVVIGTTIYYSIENHPDFKGMKEYGSFREIFEFLAISVFSMSCAGIVIPVCNSMQQPEKYGSAIGWGMMITVLFLFVISLFGMNAYRDKCTTPITLNFPMTFFPKVLKGLIAIMIYITHSLNFYTPFRLCWHYLKKRHAKHFDNPAKMLRIEKMYRAGIVVCISAVAIMFPAVTVVMGFTGSFCLSNMAFIWPNVIEILVIWPRPGFGRFYWRLWKSVILITIGMVLLIIGTAVNFRDMIQVFTA